MQLTNKIKWVFGISLLFIVLNGVLIYNQIYWFSILPLVLLLLTAAFLSIDKLLLVIVFMTPLSVPLSELVKGLPIDMFLPTEPLIAGLMFLFVLKLLFEKQFDKRVLTHPISVIIYFYLGWMFITTLTSTMPLVSLKYFISRVWFIIVFYFIATQLFRNEKNARLYILFYVLAFVIVIVYALYRHAVHGIFDEKIAHWSANPFYKDHTSYGAMLAFYIPPIIGMAFYKGYTVSKRAFYFFLTTLLFIAIAFSYTRAAWLSLIGAFGVWVVIKLKIRFSVIIAIVAITLVTFFTVGNDIINSVKKNRTDSSTDLADHVKSIANVTTDASNLERLNRWSCALRMYKQKPVFGWGPGTYMFQYAPFQYSRDLTIISTRQGDMGNAHSEYLGPLAEQGLPGVIFIVAIIITTIVTGLRALKNCNNSQIKMLGLSALIGLVTYYLHGFLNNFLDTDKASAPFWGFTALLVAIDIYYKKTNNCNDITSTTGQ